MKNDKIVVQNSFMFNDKDQAMPVYKLKKNSDGSFCQGYDGGPILEKTGGVKVGTTGKITNDGLKVHRSQLEHLRGQTSMAATNELVVVFSVYFDQYQQEAFISSDHVRII